MRPLRFIALSEDGSHLVFGADVPEAIDNGERFVVPIDDRLRAAARGDMSRLGQIEIELESSLRPREIQARIRAGHTPEQVASAAGIRVEKVMRYAYPVLQERQRLAEQARSARVRLADGTPASALAEFIQDKLTGLDADPRTAEWDARRREDGGWEVLVSWTGRRAGTTRWWFDAAARSVTPADADTSAFAERPRTATSMLVAAEPVAAAIVEPVEPEAEPEDDEDERPGGLEDLFGRREPEPGPAGDKAKPKVPSWEDIVFGVRRKR